jgi:D-3-phosphoglycerate dehydrogenase
MLLAAVRHVVNACAAMRQGKWNRDKYPGAELAGKTIGIVGLGRIGRRVAEMAKAWGLRVVGNSPSAFRSKRRRDAFRSRGIELMDLDEVLREADFVTLHTPLNGITTKMIGREQLRRMKKTAVLINTSRGAVIDDEALVEALKNRTIAAACLDVFEREPPTDSPFLELDNAIVTPHLAASTREAQSRAASGIAREFVRFFRRGKAPSAVNPQALARDKR